MNEYSNHEIAWLHLQDLQREAENRRLITGGRQPSATAVLRRLFARHSAAPVRAATADCRQEPA